MYRCSNYDEIVLIDFVFDWFQTEIHIVHLTKFFHFCSCNWMVCVVWIKMISKVFLGTRSIPLLCILEI